MTLSAFLEAVQKGSSTTTKDAIEATFVWVCGQFSLAPAAEDLGNEEHGLRRSAPKEQGRKAFWGGSDPTLSGLPAAQRRRRRGSPPPKLCRKPVMLRRR